MIGPDFKLLRSEKGRANQMNLGAEESHGDILFSFTVTVNCPQDH